MVPVTLNYLFGCALLFMVVVLSAFSVCVLWFKSGDAVGDDRGVYGWLAVVACVVFIASVAGLFLQTFRRLLEFYLAERGVKNEFSQSSKSARFCCPPYLARLC